MNSMSPPNGALRTLFLQAPSFDGFDGGAGSRYQAKREIKSFWFPTWLAQPAAMVPNSRSIREKLLRTAQLPPCRLWRLLPAIGPVGVGSGVHWSAMLNIPSIPVWSTTVLPSACDKALAN